MKSVDCEPERNREAMCSRSKGFGGWRRAPRSCSGDPPMIPVRGAPVPPSRAIDTRATTAAISGASPPDEPSNLKIGIAHPWSWAMLPGTDTRSGKTRFARDSLACEFWCVSLNRATRKCHLAMSPLRAYSQPRSARPQLQSYNTRCGIENVTTNPDFAGTSAHGIRNCCGLAPWPLKMDRAQIIGGSCSKARKAAPPLPGKIDLHRHQEVLPCHCGERLGKDAE
jgi:hypothetical protein